MSTFTLILNLTNVASERIPMLSYPYIGGGTGLTMGSQDMFDTHTVTYSHTLTCTVAVTKAKRRLFLS